MNKHQSTSSQWSTRTSQIWLITWSTFSSINISTHSKHLTKVNKPKGHNQYPDYIHNISMMILSYNNFILQWFYLTMTLSYNDFILWWFNCVMLLKSFKNLQQYKDGIKTIINQHVVLWFARLIKCFIKVIDNKQGGQHPIFSKLPWLNYCYKTFLEWTIRLII